MQTIAVDVDDVLSLSAEAFLEFSNKRWGTKLAIGDFQENFGAMWQIDDPDAAARFKIMAEEGIHGTYKSADYAETVLRRLKKHYKLVITTSRTKTIASITAEWLERHMPGIFEEIHHTGFYDSIEDFYKAHTATKAELCRQIGADYLIDDQPKHCIAAGELGIKSLLFGDYPWSNEVQLNDNVVRIKDWKKVGEYFNV